MLGVREYGKENRELVKIMDFFFLILKWASANARTWNAVGHREDQDQVLHEKGWLSIGEIEAHGPLTGRRRVASHRGPSPDLSAVICYLI